MGNTIQCDVCVQTITKFDHPAYGNYQLQQQHVLSLQRKIQKTKQNQCKANQILEYRLQFKSKNLSNRLINQVTLQKYQIIEEPYSFKYKLYFEFVEQTLQDRMKKKQFQQSLQNEILIMIEQVQAALKYLQRHKINHLNISAKTILYNNGVYMICDNKLTTNLTAYEKALRQNQPYALSQKLLYYLRGTSYSPPYDLQDDLFSLGLTSLAIVMNVDINIFYDWEKKQLKKKQIECCLNAANKKVSSRLIKKIRNLIQQEGSLTRMTSLCEQLSILNEQYQNLYKKIKNNNIMKF